MNGSTISQRRSYSREQFGQHETDSVVFAELWLHILLSLFIYFNFHCLLLLERDREHGVNGEGLGGLQGEERL